MPQQYLNLYNSPPAARHNLAQVRRQSWVLPDQIHNAPSSIPLLYVLERKRCDFGAPESATQEYGGDGPVAQPFIVVESDAFRSAWASLL